MMGEYDAGYENCIDSMVKQMEYMQYRIDCLHAENAKLREQIHWLKKGDILHVLTDQEYIDQCERERLMQVSIDALDKENAKLRELLVGAFEDMDAWQKVIAGSNEWGYGKGCLDRLCKLRDAMQELGMEVEVR